MNIGTSVPLPAYTIDPAFMAKKAEDLGFESIWYAEHAAVPVHSDSPFPATGGEIPWTYSHFTDPYIALARASGATSKIMLGTGITLVPERNPILLAKEIASLDRFSGGRFLGILVALPVAAALNVLVRNMLQKYRQSELYKLSADGDS